MTLTSCRGRLLGCVVVIAGTVGLACARTEVPELHDDCTTEDAGVEPRQEAGVVGTTTPPGRVAQLAVDDAGSACAVMEDGRVFCWGRQLGDGELLYDTAHLPISTQPREIPALAGTTQLALDRGRACALGQDRRIRCWGQPFSHEFPPWPSPRLEPFDIGAEDALRIGMNVNFLCWVRSDAKTLCWGINSYLGAYPDIEWDLAHSSRLEVPTEVPGVGPAMDVVVAGGITCALLLDRTVKCWGGILSSDPTFTDYGAVEVPDLTDVVEINGASRLSVITADGRARVMGSWGWTINPQSTYTYPRASGSRVRQITGPTATGAGTLVVMEDGYLDFSTEEVLDYRIPKEDILTGRNYTFEGDVTFAAPGTTYACVLTSGNEVHCVGTNMHGQLGDGTTTDRPRFVPVLWPPTPEDVQ